MEKKIVKLEDYMFGTAWTNEEKEDFLKFINRVLTSQMAEENIEKEIKIFEYNAKFWLKKYNEAEDMEEKRIFHKHHQRNFWYALAYKELVPSNNPPKVRYGCVYLDGTEGYIYATSTDEALSLVPSGTQVF